MGCCSVLAAGRRRSLRPSAKIAMVEKQTRHLAAIMFTDVAGYTALMQRDEQTARQVRDRHRIVLKEALAPHGGELLEHYGDGSLTIFASAIEAVRCALKIQKILSAPPVVPLRIGIHTGDVVREDQGVYGDGVNVASRIQGICPPGEVFISGKVFDDVKNQPGMSIRSLGRVDLKNISRRMAVFAVTMAIFPRARPWAGHALRPEAHLKSGLPIRGALLSDVHGMP